MKVVKAVVAVVDVPRSAKERLKVPWPRPSQFGMSFDLENVEKRGRGKLYFVQIWDLPRAKVACRVAASLPAAG